MSDEEREQQPAEETPRAEEPAAEAKPESGPERAELPAEFVAVQAARDAKWDSGGRPGKWTTIGCGLGIVILIGALFAGSSLLRRTVWAGYAGTSQRLMSSLPGDLPPGERMRLQRNLERFGVHVKQRTDDYADLGDFQKQARAALEDRRLTRDEVEGLNALLESKLPPTSMDVPYSMP
jgi:hypothetical protein